jgi:hypothetical protein
MCLARNRQNTHLNESSDTNNETQVQINENKCTHKVKKHSRNHKKQTTETSVKLRKTLPQEKKMKLYIQTANYWP